MLTLEGRGEEQAGGKMGGSFRWCQPSLLPPLHMRVYLPHVHIRMLIYFSSVSSIFQVVEGVCDRDGVYEARVEKMTPGQPFSSSLPSPVVFQVAISLQVLGAWENHCAH